MKICFVSQESLNRSNESFGGFKVLLLNVTLFFSHEVVDKDGGNDATNKKFRER